MHNELISRMRGPLAGEEPLVVAELKEKYLAPPSTLPYNLTRHNIVKLKLGQSFGWEFYHYYIKYFFGDQRGGFFLEAGALDGEVLSNTLWLEMNLGWSGLLIEADPGNFQHLTWRRRRAWTSNTCIAKEKYPREAVFEVLQPDNNVGDNQWIFKANTRETDSYFTKFYDELSGSSRRSYSMAQCFPLVSYLLALNVTTIDLLSLDIQGNEWEVIKSLSPGQVVVRAMAVEHFAPAESFSGGQRLDEAFIKYMEGVGYILVDVNLKTDYFFILKTDQRLRVKSDPDTIVKYKNK
ncbi:uncharacterized protein LOC121853158 [Homarus americanus]|uniref:uncharacterized protein LOC121853158 n=1 Tax=Homarus americanus TaxID=6706 RepID=UPI001C43C7C6|nr:uncharacterized protein LOC121853158 [Homarus americanus]